MAIAPSSQRDHAVGGGQAALEPVLGEHDRGPPLLVDAAQDAEQLVAGDGVELGGRLVEQQQPRPPGQRRAERDALELAAGQLVRRAVEQPGDAERERGLLHPARDRRRAPAAVLERERELGAHRAHHDLRLGVLEQRAGDRGQLGRAVLARVEAAGHAAGPANSPPWKCGTSPAAARSSVDLPEPEPPASTTNSPGSTRSETSAQRRPRRARIGVGDALEDELAHRPIRLAHGVPRAVGEREQSARRTSAAARASSAPPTGASSRG